MKLEVGQEEMEDHLEARIFALVASKRDLSSPSQLAPYPLDKVLLIDLFVTLDNGERRRLKVGRTSQNGI